MDLGNEVERVVAEARGILAALSEKHNVFRRLNALAVAGEFEVQQITTLH